MMPLIAFLFPAALAAHSAAPPSRRLPAIELRLVAEMAPDLQRRCIPGPHELGRTMRLPGTPATSSASWFNSRSLDAFPHCGDDDTETAPRLGKRPRRLRK